MDSASFSHWDLAMFWKAMVARHNYSVQRQVELQCGIA
jgi:hypothetical protein